MRNLIIGAGEVGRALYKVFLPHHQTCIRDIDLMGGGDPREVDVLHIAFPYSDRFVAEVKRYISEYKPKLTIIHSSVKVGTTEECGPHVVHSPVRGRHPNLAKEMPIYIKFIGGGTAEDRALAAEFIAACDWTCRLFASSRDTERLKLLSNVHMGLEIAWRQEVARIGVNDDIYRQWEDNYFDGYRHLNQERIIRPRMDLGPIGGHCILQCLELLDDEINPELAYFIVESNEQTKEKQHARSNELSEGPETRSLSRDADRDEAAPNLERSGATERA